MAVLAPDVVIVGDGDGLARAPRQPVNGSDKVARLILAFVQRAPDGIKITLELINGQLGLVGRVGGEPVTVMAVTVDAGQVQALHLIAHPEKLTPVRIGGRVEMRYFAARASRSTDVVVARSETHLSPGELLWRAFRPWLLRPSGAPLATIAAG